MWEDPIFDAVGPHTKETHDSVVILSRLIEFMCDIGSAAATNLAWLDETPVALTVYCFGFMAKFGSPNATKEEQ